MGVRKEKRKGESERRLTLGVEFNRDGYVCVLKTIKITNMNIWTGSFEEFYPNNFPMSVGLRDVDFVINVSRRPY